ncbi:hypothetical protein EDB84DRAFT_1588415 [Lactarius hengduanensis]|nr:hypothetical protein EDB84DRAFT_1588415 [Lactarius hengduanensis]
MPHPLRTKANGRMVYTVPVILFMDDASANISKQWNKHIVVYLSNAGLPREMLDKEFCIKFVTSSPNASPMELMRAVRDSIDKALDSPVATFDCKTKEEVLIIPYLIFTASDNPMHAEQTSQCGLNANFFCRTCDVGGTKAQKKSEEGFAKIFEVGNIPAGALLLSGGSEKVDSLARSTGIKDAAVVPIIKYITAKGKALRSNCDSGGRQLPAKHDCINLLIGMPEQLENMAYFRHALPQWIGNGLNAPSTDTEYICQYHGSLIGSTSKSLVQVMPFLIYGPCMKMFCHAWNIIGTLLVLLWHTEIEDIEVLFASRVHIRCLAPWSISTERYESFNQVSPVYCASYKQLASA